MKSTRNIRKQTKYIVITGGVLSGLGKGIATASIGCLLRGSLRVIPVKCDGYLNSDPGTINPIEHGEVFVLDDGGEVDMDFGHYERFIGVNAKRSWNITMGKIYKEILDRERKGVYLGKTVQLIPHVTDRIKRTIYDIGTREKADVMLIEVGGTVGDMEIELFVESVRQMWGEVGRENIMFVHLTYVPIPANTMEPKSKPTQQSVKMLNQFGIYPDVIIGRCSKRLPPSLKQKIALHCNIDEKAVISGMDVDVVYEVPFLYQKEGLDDLIKERLNLPTSSFLTQIEPYVRSLKRKQSRIIRLGLCGKYTQLGDSYASIHEAIRHVCAHLKIHVETVLIETSDLTEQDVSEKLDKVHAVIVPGGFGIRGMEGKIEVIRYIRQQQKPFLGICLGMQLAVIEYARNVAGLQKATTREVEQEGLKVTTEVVVDVMEDQKQVSQKGGTMRLGGHTVILKDNSHIQKIYGQNHTQERFRHRYEINPLYVPILEKAGLVFSGKNRKESLMQVIELPQNPFFIGCQFHPELNSKLEKPSPLFYALFEAALDQR